jgi:hypothetical protein
MQFVGRGARPTLAKAKILGKNNTPGEIKLWGRLRSRRFMGLIGHISIEVGGIEGNELFK